MLDLLPDRTPETLADWLRQRPGIEVIARHRSMEHARGIGLGAPGATQVAARVRKYAYAEGSPVPEAQRLRSSIMDSYLAQLQTRLVKDCENALAPWRELRTVGLPADGRAGASLACRALNGARHIHLAQVADRVACCLVNTNRAWPPVRVTRGNAASVAARPTPGSVVGV